MSLLTAVFLGLVQGLTEFLPISSSGHLVLAQHVFGLHEPMLFFDIVLHVGTLLAVCAFYWRDLLGLIGIKVKGALATPYTAILIGAGTVPTVAVALVGREFFTSAFASIPLVAGALMVTGGILWTTRFAAKRREPSMRLRDALAIGLAQGCAITPGISRSGTTIAAALWLGLDRDTAARYSFLLAIPAIVGAVVLEWEPPSAMDSRTVTAFALGLLAAAGSGYWALRWLVRLIHQGAFWKFAPYCWAVGGLGLVLTSLATPERGDIEVHRHEPQRVMMQVIDVAQYEHGR